MVVARAHFVVSLCLRRRSLVASLTAPWQITMVSRCASKPYYCKKLTTFEVYDLVVCLMKESASVIRATGNFWSHVVKSYAASATTLYSYMYGSISPVAYLDLPQPCINHGPANVSLRSHNRRRQRGRRIPTGRRRLLIQRREARASTRRSLPQARALGQALTRSGRSRQSPPAWRSCLTGYRRPRRP